MPRTSRAFVRRHGYTLVELLLVVAIVGIVVAISMPRLGSVRARANMASATTRFTKAVMAARQSAIQRGKRAYFKHNNNYVWVILDVTGVAAESVVVTSALSLNELYGVQVTAPAGLTAIEYDPRGVATQTEKQVFHFVHVASGRRDSLCVSRLGNTIRERCP